MTFQVNGDSKEAVAYGLMQCILHAGGRGNQEHPYPAGSTLLRGKTACTEGDMLVLYARCLRVVEGVDPASIPDLCREGTAGMMGNPVMPAGASASRAA